MNVLSIQRITYFLIAAFLLLLLAHIYVVLQHYMIAPDNQFYRRLDHFFDFDEEVNFPTYFSSILLFISAQTFFFLGIKNKDKSWYTQSNWFLFTLLFLLLSVDDFVQIHEWMSVYTQHAGFDGKGILHFAWLIPYAVVGVGLVIFCFKFVFRIDKFFRTQYILCGFLFLFGTFIIEAFGELYYESIKNVPNLVYKLFFISLEESLKMIALILLIKTNLLYLNTLKMQAELKG